jgi:arginine/ornithine N-succinyltransferase beta subunit
MLGSEEPGVFEIGGYSLDQARSPLVWLSLNESFFWMTTVDGFRIGNLDSSPKNEGMATRSYRAIFDTGTSLTLLPKCKLYIADINHSYWNKGDIRDLIGKEIRQ